MTPQQYAYMRWRLEVNRFMLAKRLVSEHAVIRRYAKQHRYESWRLEQAARIPPERHNRKQAAWYEWICSTADLYERYCPNVEHPEYRAGAIRLREHRDAALGTLKGEAA